MEGFGGDMELKYELLKFQEGFGDALPGLSKNLAAEFCTYWSLFEDVTRIDCEDGHGSLQYFSRRQLDL